MPPMNDPSIPFSTTHSGSVPTNTVFTRNPLLTVSSMAPSIQTGIMAPSAILGSLDVVTPPASAKIYADAVKIIGIQNVAKLPAEYITGPILLQLAQLNDVNRQVFFQTIGSTHLNVCSEPSTSNSTQFCGGGLGVGGSSMATSTCSSINMNTSSSINSIPMMPSTSMIPKAGQHQHFMTNHFMTSADGSPSVFNLEYLPKQGSPLNGGIYRVAKNEPSSTSSSQPGTPLQSDRRSVPACAICGTDSTGIHFGVDACAACSAFFRRTVVLNKTYTCNKGGQCIIVKDGSIGQKCRACRFKKCITVGMDRNSVQHRRDAIGKYAAGVKREHSPDVEIEQPPAQRPPVLVSEPITPSNAASNSPIPPPPVLQSNVIRTDQASSSSEDSLPSYPHSNSILQTLIDRQTLVCEQRQLFYAAHQINEWFLTPETSLDTGLRELKNFTSCMFDLWKVEPRIAAEFMRRNKHLDALDRVDNLAIFRNFVVLRQAVEEPFLTWKHGGLEKQWFVMPNRTYIDFNDPEKYFSNGALKDLKLDLATATNLFLPSFQGAMQSVGCLMRNIQITETEIVILLGLVLLDPAIGGIKDSTRQQLKNIRDQLIQDVFIYYEEEEPSFEPEIRMADLFMILSAIKIHAIKTSENMHLIRIFDLIPDDPCFNQILEVTPDVPDVLGSNNNGAFQPFNESRRAFSTVPPSPANFNMSKSNSSTDLMNSSPKVQVVIVTQAALAPSDYRAQPNSDGSDIDVND